MGKERIENFIQKVGKNWWMRKAKEMKNKK